MNNFRQQVDNITSFGEFDFAPFYEEVVRKAPAGATLVEIGNYHGRSLCYLALMAREANRDLKVVGVDWGRGMGDNRSWPTIGNCFANLMRLGLHDFVTLVTAPTHKAAELFADGSCWFTYVDDDHTEEGAMLSFRVWAQKTQKGGIAAGHDYFWPGPNLAARTLHPNHKVEGNTWYVENYQGIAETSATVA